MPRVEKFGIFYYVEAEKVAFGQNKVAFEARKAAFERSISKIRINTPAKDKAPALIQMFRSAARKVTDTRKVAIAPV